MRMIGESVVRYQERKARETRDRTAREDANREQREKDGKK